MRSYHDIVGDGGSRVLEQVLEQRAKMATALSGVRHLVAVGSGKGGVGKSTLTLGLAAAAAAAGSRVAVLDADLNGPSQARLAGLGATPLVPASTADGATLALPRNAAGIGVVSLGALVPESDAVEFDSVAEGDSHVWRATRELAFLGQLVASVEWGTLDLLFVDLPPGAERTFQLAEFLGPRAAFVLVTVPSELSHGVVARSIAALRRAPNRLLGYVENMKGYHCAGCGEVRPLFPEGEGARLDLPRLGAVPFDPALAAAFDRGDVAAAMGSGPAARELASIARAMAESLEGR